MRSDEQRLSQLGRLLALVVCLAVLMTGMLIVRVHRAAEAALDVSEQAFDRGDLVGATDAAREALTWYLPGSPHVERAVARLRALAIGAEATGDTASALRAWEALRGGLFEVAHPWSRTSETFEEAGAGVARLLLLQSRAAAPVTDKQAEADELLRQVYKAPAREPGRDWFAGASSVGMFLMLLFGARVLSGRQFGSVAELVLARAGLVVGIGMWLLAAIGY